MTHLSAVVQRALRDTIEETLRKVVADSTNRALSELLTTRSDVQQKLSDYLARELERALSELNGAP